MTPASVPLDAAARAAVGHLLSALYAEHAAAPPSLAPLLAPGLAAQAQRYGVTPPHEETFRQDVLSMAGAFAAHTDWAEYHALATGEYAALIDLPAVITRRLAALI
ncbi:hypothetical protein GO986_14395 [Deinococcus sp. HMF7620]|uniref:Uncharacterized protein n=1 Tax=Deinococcus arboris TaxID=2682977 RepID=A0A7C9HSX0_9DEIO|nr:hypothetical protein [Deinococcus arboris]MVN87947.1 hypothetical protein [Deinococcus arboris]